MSGFTDLPSQSSSSKQSESPKNCSLSIVYAWVHPQPASLFAFPTPLDKQNWGLDRNKPKGVREVKNAQERFGGLVYRRTEKTATNFRVFLDAFAGEERGKAHLVSVVGGDVEIGALAAAFANGD